MKYFLFLLGSSAALAQTAKQCADLKQFQMSGASIEVTRAEMVAAGPARRGRGGPGPMLPAHCRVDGIVDKRAGADGKTYGISFAVALPENWNNDFLQQGGGGLNGSVGEPIGRPLETNRHWRAASQLPLATRGTRAQVEGLTAHS